MQVNVKSANKREMINFRRCPRNVCSQFRGQFRVEANSLQRRNFGGLTTAGIIVIGNEILKGQVNDSNSFYASKLLYKHGIKVKKTCIVEDNIEDIAREMDHFSKKYDYVVTSGGIGPTHDDLTYQALAVAFDDTLHYHSTLVDIVKNQFGCKSLSSPAYKMAYIPSKATLTFGRNETTGEPFIYPCVVLENVYVFPGSPVYFEKSFQSICKDSFVGKRGFALAEVYVNAREETFADTLSTLAKENPNVTFGSYPELNRYYKARITIESATDEDTETARKKFCDLIPTNILVNYDRAPHVDPVAKYDKFLRRAANRPIYDISFERFVNIYKTRKPDEISIYVDIINIESIVMIHLARTVLNKLHGYATEIRLHAIYPMSNNVSPGRSRFLQEMIERYYLQVHTLHCKNEVANRVTKDVLILQPTLQTLVLGERTKTAESKIIDENLSHLVGINFQVQRPLIDWTDEDINNFATILSLPYYTIEDNE